MKDGLVVDEYGLVVDEFELKKDGLVVGALELKKDLNWFISNLDPFHIHLVRHLTSALSGFKTKGVRRRQWRIVWSFQCSIGRSL
ncbi:hypothetical protein L484_007091 [Morus notabilis]|uniref:Uncharacterized protein n=1 Tax=Morus notabilis TaxID=981085 RepID=W9S2H4_9ROSA|nr:hypothetical protein L484_007091 [Morus notabilis]